MRILHEPFVVLEYFLVAVLARQDGVRTMPVLSRQLQLVAHYGTIRSHDGQPGRHPIGANEIRRHRLQWQLYCEGFGDAEPDFQMSWFNTLTWKNFDLAFLWHWKKGGEAINLSKLLFDLGETSSDFDEIDLDPNGVLGNGPYRVSQIGVNTGALVEDASYIRLREIGLYYSLPEDAIKDIGLRFGVSATNLINIFDYNSYDPEVSNFGSDGLSTQLEVNPFPSSKRYDFHIIAEF